MLTDLAPAPATVPVASVPGRAIRWTAFLPGAVVVLAAVGVLGHYGVGPGTQARFAAQLLGVVLVPGILAWRALRGRAGPLPADLAGGAALGYSMEIGWYLIGRAAGFPYLHVVAAGGIVAAFLAVPRLRRHWAGAGRPAGARWSWSVAVLCLLMLAWAAVTYLGPHGLGWPGYGHPYQDMVFHQSLVGELRHHLPAQMPSVAGLPLSYHWFVHAEWAAVSWSTGIEPALLTYRLGLLPAVLLLVVAMAAVAGRIVPGPWWSGPLAAALALFALAPDPAGWSLTAVPAADIPGTMWLSPTQTFGGLLFAGAVLVLADLLRQGELDSRAGTGRWVAFTLLVAGATGGKATYAPLLIAGLGTVVAADLLHRRINGRALAAAAITAAALGVATVTMFPGTSGGLFVDPLASLAGTFPRSAHPGWTAGHALAIWALGWSAILAAGIVLLGRRGRLDPMLPLCAGIGAAALGVVLLTRQMGSSQMYFLVSARPYVAVLVVAALVLAAPGGGRARRPGVLVPLAAVAGSAVTVLGELSSPARAPAAGTVAILWPYALPLVTAVMVGLLLRLPRRTRPIALVAAGAVLLGAAVPTAIEYGRYLPYRNVRVASGPPAVPRGAPEAGRWLRAHTGTGDLLATNGHCRLPGETCDPRQFWLAAWAERRVLVEGWAFTPPANAIAARDRLGSDRVPYWDPGRLAENDAAFRRPSAATVGRLRSRYGVRWLVVDTGRPADLAGLGRVAEPRYRAGQVVIYQVA
ncbi:MAG TPA: hypothetical protein VFR35_19655 [Actinoplanes sp.]|nr:hypothetical protein [Actinoplanes sp.]